MARLLGRAAVALCKVMAAPIDPLPTTTEDPEYIDNWDVYFLQIAQTVARKSKDPRCRVGAVIVQEHQVIQTGFNGIARNVYDDPKVLADAGEKLNWICHAEQNAVFNSARQGTQTVGATIYVTKFPCAACCNAITSSTILAIAKSSRSLAALFSASIACEMTGS